LRVSSSLKGAVVDLPAPFGLAANESRNSVFRMTLQGAERRYWFDYGDLANLTFAAPDGKFEDGRGELFLGSGAPVLPTTKGLRIRGVLSELDVAPWQALVERYAGNDPGGSAKQLLSSADFKVGKLIAFGTQLDQVRLVMKRVAASWALQIDSKQAIGAVTLPDAKNAPIVVNMQTIRLPAPTPRWWRMTTPPIRWRRSTRVKYRRWTSLFASFTRALSCWVPGRSTFGPTAAASA
jgi:Predicted membrane protein